MNFSQIKEYENDSYMPVFTRDNIAFDHGEGNCLYDVTGKKFVDFVAGIASNSLGYNHPRLTKTIAEQASKLIHISNHYYTEVQSNYARALTKASGFDRVFFANSGAEANECAIKLIRRHTVNQNNKKSVILVSEGSFHGRTLATLSMTANESQRALYAPLPEGFRFFAFNDFKSFKEQMRDDVAAVFIESIQGESGVRPFSDEFIINAYALAKSKGALFALDEVQTGFGRSGKLFSFEHYGIKPDIITVAKGIAGGVPMGGCLARGECATAFKAGDHGSTFGGNPLACACAMCVLNELTENGLMDRAAIMGEYLGNKLASLTSFPFVVEVRGKGLLRGIELAPEIKNARIEGMLASVGFLVNSARHNTIRLVPPLTITETEIDALVENIIKIFRSFE